MEKTDILNEIKKIHETLLGMTKKIDLLDEKVTRLDKSSSKMDEHINFVEGTYETLRSPLDFITSNINKMRRNIGDTSDETESLPKRIQDDS